MLLGTDGDRLKAHQGYYDIELIYRFTENEWRCIGSRNWGFNKADCNDNSPTEYYIYYKHTPAGNPNVQAIVKDLGPYYHNCGLLAFYIEETEHEVLINLPKFVLACDDPPHPTKVMDFLKWGCDKDNIWNCY